MLKGRAITGFEFRTFAQFEPEQAARNERELIQLLADGSVDPHISAVHELDDVALAVADVAGRRSTGKVLIATGSRRP